MAMASASLFLHGTSDLHLVGKWWDHVNDSEEWQDGIFFLLCAMYSFVAAFTLIQLIRIQNRVPELTWTTQKVFHLLNFIVNAVRALVFGFHHDVFVFHPRIFRIVFLDMPGLLFFSTYSLLVLFWAEIYHQARSSPDERLRPRFIMINAVIYLLQLLIWAYEWWSPGNVVNATAKLFLAVVSFSAAAGFLLYGGRLFLMLRRFPIESKGRRNKLREVGFVTAICFSCFIVRCVVLALSAFDSDLDIDVLDHPILNLVFYVLVEILPSSLVLFILRKLPQKRVSGQYQSIR